MRHYCGQGFGLSPRAFHTEIKCVIQSLSPSLGLPGAPSGSVWGVGSSALGTYTISKCFLCGTTAVFKDLLQNLVLAIVNSFLRYI